MFRSSVFQRHAFAVRAASCGLAFTIFGLHLLATILFLMPGNILKNRFASFAEYYMTQFFNQDWHLFAPNPGTTSTKMWVRCEMNGNEWTEYGDPAWPTLQAHYRNRFSPAAKLLYIYRAIPDQLKRDVVGLHRELCGDKKQLGPMDGVNPVACATFKDEIRKSKWFAVATRYATDKCRNEVGDRLTASQFMIVTLHPIPYTKRSELTTKPFSKVESLKFDEVRL